MRVPDRWLGKKTWVVRNAPQTEIRARTRRSFFWGWWEVEHPGSGAGTLWWGALVDANAILSQKLIYGIKEFRVKRLGKGVEVVRRGGEGEWGARCCVRVMTRRLLEEQIAVVIVLERGEKNDAMWHMPQLFNTLLYSSVLKRTWRNVWPFFGL